PGDLIRLLADDGVGFDSPTAGSRIVLDVFDVSRIVDPRDLGWGGGLPTVLPTASTETAFVQQLFDRGQSPRVFGMCPGDVLLEGGMAVEQGHGLNVFGFARQRSVVRCKWLAVDRPRPILSVGFGRNLFVTPPPISRLA